VPSQPLLDEASRDVRFYAYGNRAARTSFTLSQGRSYVGGAHALQGFIPAPFLLDVIAPSALFVREALLGHLPSRKNGTSAKSRNATAGKVGTQMMTTTKCVKTGGSDGARTRDLRRDRPTL